MPRPLICLIALAIAAPVLAAAPATAPANDKLLRFDQHNFVVDRPPIAWIQMSEKELPSGGVALYQRRSPNAILTIIAEPVGIETALTPQELEAAVLRNMRDEAPDAQVMDKKPVTINGAQGLQLDVHARVANTLLAYRFWICSRNGYMYQLIGHSAERDEDRMHDVIDPLVASFRQIEPDRVLHTPGMEKFQRFQSPRFGYVIDLPDDWRVWKNIEQDMPDAETGALRGDESCLGVLPVAFLGESPDLEAVGTTLMTLFDIEWKKVSDLRRITEGNLQGYTCKYARERDTQRYDYQFKILRGDGFAYVVAAWTRDPKLIKELPAWLDSVKRPTDKPVAATADALTPSERKTHAVILREFGLTYYQKAQYDRAIKYFQLSAPLQPDDPVSPANEVQCYIMQEAYEKARDVASQRLKQLPHAPVLLCKYALALGKTNQLDEALKAYARAFKDDYVNDFQFENYMALLQEADKSAEACAAIEKYRKLSPELRLLLIHSQVLADLKRHDDAIKLLTDKQTEIGFNGEITATLAERFCDAERYQEAIDTAKKLVDSGVDPAYAHFLLGRAQTGLKWYREAKTSFETSLSHDRNYDRAKRMLDHVSGMLGEGDSAAVREALDPVAIPPELLEGLPATQPSHLADQPAVYRARVRAVSFERNKQLRVTSLVRIEILNRQGVELFSTMQYPFDPLKEQLYVNKLEVRDASGKKISSADPSQYFLVDDRSASGMASTERTLNVPIPGLKPGYVVEAQVTRRDRAVSEHFPFDDWFFSSSSPSARATYYLTGDVDSVKAGGTLLPAPKKLDRALAWSIDWPRVYKNEPLQQELQRYMPNIALADSAATWQSEAKEYVETIKPLLATDDSVKKLAAEITEGVSTPREKLAAILRHLQQDYTYKAIEFGRRARIPQKGVDVIHNRYGDCKDHALLLRQLLESCGIEAKLALVSTGHSLWEDLPSFDQFNHMIVYAPGLKRFFDCTDKDSDLSDGVPAWLAKHKTLVLNDDGSAAIIPIGEYSKGSSTVSTRRQIQITQQGDLDIRETVSATGISASYLRSNFRGVNPSSRSSALQNFLSAYADLTVRDVQLKNLDEVDRPFILESSYIVRRSFTRDGGSLTGAIPALWERFYCRPDHVEQRETPFEITYPTKIRCTTTLTLPQGTRLSAVPQNASSASAFAESSVTYQSSATDLIADATTQKRTGEHPASAYASFEEAMHTTISSLEPRLVFESTQPPTPARRP